MSSGNDHASEAGLHALLGLITLVALGGGCILAVMSAIKVVSWLMDLVV